ncbi:MAG: phosphatase PAP2 family protein [Sphingobacteriaceae bacterium]
MLDHLIQLDHQWFHAINQGLSNTFFDFLMPILRNRFTWIPLYLLLVYFWVKKFGKAGVYMILFLLLCFAISDYTASSVIKPAVARLRPCKEMAGQINNLIPCGSGYSFPSSHAANHFAMALFFIVLFYKRGKWILPSALLWAFFIGFAQIYVGVHFPIDVICGAILGSVIGGLLGLLFLRLIPEVTWKSGK